VSLDPSLPSSLKFQLVPASCIHVAAAMERKGLDFSKGVDPGFASSLDEGLKGQY
jgi:hypothetical protein